jgi:hypothetical protein
MIVVFDLDNTLADCRWRKKWANEKQWEEFHSRANIDLPHYDALFLWMHLPRKVCPIIVTGRPEKYRSQTLQWLVEFIGVPKDQALLMRPDDNFESAAILKPKMLLDYFGGNISAAYHEVFFILEDDPAVVQAYRALGFNCWQVRDGL